MDEVETTRAYYDQNARVWTERKNDSFYLKDQFQEFVRYVRDTQAHILDIGCAGGIHVPLFETYAPQFSYEGMDVSEEMVAIAASAHPQHTFFVGNVANADTLPQKRYDGFWASAVLMHIPEEKWGAMFENIASRMRPGAIGFISVPRERPNPRHEGDKRHFTLLDAHELAAYCAKHDWQVEAQGAYENPDGTTSGWHWGIVRLPAASDNTETSFS